MLAERTDGVFFSLLDQLRAVAALLVVASHLVGNFLAYMGMRWAPNDLAVSFIEQPLQAAIHFGWFGVVAFFFISGFVITRAATRESGIEFALKRVLRIYPPLVFTVLVVVLLAAFGIYTVGITALPTLSESLLAMSLGNWLVPGQPTAIVAVGWTLVIEMLFYIAMLGLRPVLLRVPWLVPVLLVAIAVGATFLPAASGWASSAIAYLAFVPLLVLGQLVYLVRTSQIGIRFGLALIATTALAEVAALARTNPTFSQGDYHANAAIAFLVFVILVLVEDRIRPTALLALIARRSYSLYLLHVPIGFTVLELVVRASALPYTLALIIALVATAAATEVCYRLVERPSIALGKRAAVRLRA